MISVIDGGSSPDFLAALNQLKLKGNLIWQKEKPETSEERQKRGGGQGMSRRQAAEIAENTPGIKVIMQTEPEKISMIGDWLRTAAQPILHGEADIVIPDVPIIVLAPIRRTKQVRKNAQTRFITIYFVRVNYSILKILIWTCGLVLKFMQINLTLSHYLRRSIALLLLKRL